MVWLALRNTDVHYSHQGTEYHLGDEPLILIEDVTEDALEV